MKICRLIGESNRVSQSSSISDAGIKCNLKKLAVQGELPGGQERVAWAMYVSFFSSQPGKCRSVKPMYQWYIGSVGATCFTGGEPPDVVSACTRLQASQKCLHFCEIVFSCAFSPRLV